MTLFGLLKTPPWFLDTDKLGSPLVVASADGNGYWEPPAQGLPLVVPIPSQPNYRHRGSGQRFSSETQKSATNRESVEKFGHSPRIIEVRGFFY